MSENETVTVEVELSSQLFQQLVEVARSRQTPVGQVAESALAEWLAAQGRLDQGRALMRELGRGLGESRAPYDTARNHDEHLYRKDE